MQPHGWTWTVLCKWNKLVREDRYAWFHLYVEPNEHSKLTNNIETDSQIRSCRRGGDLGGWVKRAKGLGTGIKKKSTGTEGRREKGGSMVMEETGLGVENTPHNIPMMAYRRYTCSLYNFTH